MAKNQAQSSAKKKTIKKKAPKVSTGATTDLVRRVTLDRQKSKKALPEFQTGDSIGVYVKVKEGEKERVQLFAGVVLKVQGSGVGRSFTVRKIASGVGVERTFPMLSPVIDRVEIISRGKVRRSRLFFLRGLKGRSARLDSEAYFAEEDAAVAGAPAPTTEGAEAASAPEAPKAKKAVAKAGKDAAKK